MILSDTYESPVYFVRTKFFSNSTPSMHKISKYAAKTPKNAIFGKKHMFETKVPYLSIWALNILAFEFFWHSLFGSKRNFKIP